MVVSGSDTCHSAGRAVCDALASAAVAPSANSAAKGAIKRRRSLVIIGSSWGLAVTGATLRIAEAAAKATRTSLNGAYRLSLSFQDLILTLHHYWGAQGCAILQPYDMEMGAGTFHPATVLRSLGPDPWRAAYVQPCRRPTDGRYGENPNRLGHYYQYQVVLKPSPEDLQELYLGSLREIGIDPLKHDIRFVEDDWESPTLGAWGLGWEVWGEGMEVTQFHYFQQVGGVECRTVTGEVTYRLEGLAMYIQ